MEYEPLKKRIAAFFRNHPVLRPVLFRILDVVLLRAWHVKKALRSIGLDRDKPLAILDAGAGFGQVAESLIRRFPKAVVTAVDIDPEHVEDGNLYFVAKAPGRVKFLCQDLVGFEAPEPFDLVVSVDVLEHIDDDRTVVRRFAECLKPGGHVLVTTPSLYRRSSRDGAFVAEHFREGYSDSSMRHLFGEAGFDSIRIRYAYGFWGDLSWKLGIRTAMGLAGKGVWGKVAAVLVFGAVSPLVFALMALDFVWPNRRGTGIVLVARKPEIRT